MERNDSLLREMLSELSTQQLDGRLAEELAKDIPDEEAVQTMLDILRQREKNVTVTVSPELREAWISLQQQFRPKKRTSRASRWLLRAASVGIVLVLLFGLIPQQANADNFWDRLVRWTDDVFEFLDPHGKEAVQDPYVFQTDNPGLQQVYDKVVDMGITEPVVPMWLPEGYELVEVKEIEIQLRNELYFMFSDGSSELIFDIKLLEKPESGIYQKDRSDVEILEYQSTEYFIFRNLDKYNITWIKDNFECFLVVDCQEDIYRILKSIHG